MESKKIYLIVDDYDDEKVKCVYSTREQAEEYIDRSVDLDLYIEEVELDSVPVPEPEMQLYKLFTTFYEDDDVRIANTFGEWSGMNRSYEPDQIFVEDHRLWITVLATGKKESIAEAKVRAEVIRKHWTDRYPFLRRLCVVWVDGARRTSVHPVYDYNKCELYWPEGVEFVKWVG